MTVEENLSVVHKRIDAACAASGREPDEVTLIAVSKNQPLEALTAAYEAGHRHFGESRLQEALPKIAAMPPDAVWHFVGNLQSNKARRVAETFSLVHSVYKVSQVAELEKHTAPTDVLIEVNLAAEVQKGGVFVESLDELVSLLLNCSYVRLQGLMTVGPATLEPEEMRSTFRTMRELRDRSTPGGWLSMGMSGDYAVAIQEGSTHVRVGTAIFGSRQY